LVVTQLPAAGIISNRFDIGYHKQGKAPCLRVPMAIRRVFVAGGKMLGKQYRKKVHERKVQRS
jgi:hypothetical protein